MTTSTSRISRISGLYILDVTLAMWQLLSSVDNKNQKGLNVYVQNAKKGPSYFDFANIFDDSQPYKEEGSAIEWKTIWMKRLINIQLDDGVSLVYH